MSSSLDDMPSYEHFQQEMDDALLKYLKKRSGKASLPLLHIFIEFVCFHLFLDNWRRINDDVLLDFHLWIQQRHPSVLFNGEEIKNFVKENK